ncbi:MAG: DUF5990 family protein [Actinomycetota bacterium]
MSVVTVEIRGRNLPGRRCDPEPGGSPYENVHVGLARRTETVELEPGDAPAVRWRFEMEILDEEEALDFRGPYVSGGRGERSLGLRWGTLDDDDGTFTVFRAAKFRLWELDPDVVREASSSGRLIALVDLTDEEGYPRCATVRSPDVTWSAKDPPMRD